MRAIFVGEIHLPDALRDYELVVILNPDIGDDTITDTIERVHEAIRTRGGEIVDVNHWGRRRLAYPIKRHFEGNYVVSQIKLNPNRVSDLEGSLRISEEVIRHLVIQAGE
jgi:small subunit ribosomal protein S6